MTRAFRVVLIGFTAVLALGVSQAQELSRYEQWQASRPFTVGAAYYDAPYGPAAAWPPPSPYPDMDLWRQAGLNLLDDVSHSNGGHNDYPGVPTAQAAGVPFMILGAGWPGKGAPTALESFQKHVRFFADNPVWSEFCGVQLANEPQEANYQDYREQRDWLVQTYPHLLTLLNRSVTDNEDGRFLWQKEIEAIQPDVMIYQFLIYLTQDGGKPDISPGVYACLGSASEYCKAHSVGFFIERLAFDWGDSVRRINTFAALAYGARGFIDWYWGFGCYDYAPWGGYVWYEAGEETPTPLFKTMAQINREVNNLGPALIKLRHIRTYHLDLESGPTWGGPIYNFDEPDELRTGKLRAVEATTYSPNIHIRPWPWLANKRGDSYLDYMAGLHEEISDGKASPVFVSLFDEHDELHRVQRSLGQVEGQVTPDKLKPVERPTDHLMVGFFRDENDEEYFMVVNKNNTGDPHLGLAIFFQKRDPQERLQVENITLTFAPEVSGIQRLNRLTGEVEDLSLNDHSFSFSLPGGTGDLFKYTSDAPFAGISQ